MTRLAFASTLDCGVDGCYRPREGVLTVLGLPIPVCHYHSSKAADAMQASALNTAVEGAEK